mmetsp:Transcript_10586/g.31364  ORF Transcript_10586/g.31364 Transcript_10586/m.31364 type:complete len:87 (-) Transcript_10586:63-323(-)
MILLANKTPACDVAVGFCTNVHFFAHAAARLLHLPRASFFFQRWLSAQCRATAKWRTLNEGASPLMLCGIFNCSACKSSAGDVACT